MPPAHPGKTRNAPRNVNCSIICLKTALLRTLYKKCVRYVIVTNDILTYFSKTRAKYMEKNIKKLDTSMSSLESAL